MQASLRETTRKNVNMQFVWMGIQDTSRTLKYLQDRMENLHVCDTVLTAKSAQKYF